MAFRYECVSIREIFFCLESAWKAIEWFLFHEDDKGKFSLKPFYRHKAWRITESQQSSTIWAALRGRESVSQIRNPLNLPLCARRINYTILAYHWGFIADFLSKNSLFERSKWALHFLTKGDHYSPKVIFYDEKWFCSDDPYGLNSHRYGVRNPLKFFIIVEMEVVGCFIGLLFSSTGLSNVVLNVQERFKTVFWSS